MSFWSSIKPKEEKNQGPYIAPTLPTTDNSTASFRDATAKDDIIGTAKTTGTLAKAVGQGIMREGAALSSFVFPNVGTLTPTGPVQEAIYGTDKPITLTSFGRETRFADPQGESKGFWKTFDPALGLLVGVLDVMPGGKPTRSLITTFAKETSQAKIADDLAKLAPKLAPDTVWGLAGKLAVETSEAEVRSILQNADIIPPVKNVSTGVTDYDLADNKITYGEKGWKRNELTETTGGKTTVIREEEKIMDVAELPPELKNRYVEALRNKDAARGKGIEEAKAAGKNFQEVVNDIADHLGLREKNAPTPTAPVKVADEAVPPPVKNVSKGVTGKAKIENIQDEDLGELVDFIDSVRKERVPHPGNSISVRRLAERYGINPEQSDARLANAIQNKIEATPSLRERVVNRAPRRDVDVANPRNYKSAEEFVKAKTTRPDYGYGHSPNEDGVRAFNLTEKVDGEQMIPEDMYQQWYGSRGTPEDMQSISVLKSIKGKPEADVTIYRAAPNGEFNYGDWVTLSKKYAEQHAEGNNFKVFSQKVKAKDIRWAMDDVNEFGYFPENYKSQLTDIWNKANKKTTPASVLREGQPNLGVQMVKNKDGEFVSIETVVARDRFNIPNLKKLSFGGSDRDVYDLGDGNVLKVAKSARGLDQNVMADWYAADVGLIPNIIEKGKNYIVFEKVGAPDAKTKAMVAELKKLDTYLLSAESHPKHWDEQQKAYNVMAKYGYPGEELGNFGKPLWGDLTAIRNWGTKDGRPVLLDEGSLDGGLVAKHTEWVKDAEGYRVNRTKSNLDNPEFRDIYEASRRAKKRFGDTDSKTMYGGVLAGVQDTDGDGKPDDINPLMAALGVAGMGALRKTTATPNQMSQAGRLVDDLVPPGGVDIPPTTGAQAGKISDTLSSSKTVAQKFKTVFTNIVEHVQNSEERVRQLVTRKDLNTATDPYEIMTLYHGRVGRKIEEGYQRAEEIADDIISFSGRNKTDVLNGRQEVNDYLQALHAGERNAAHGEGAAGITTAEAAEILKKASPEVKAVANKALDLNNKTLDLLKDSGVITPELYTTLRTKYKNHVPLQRVMDEQDDIGAVLSGRGFDVRSTGVKAAKGSDRQVADILTNIVNNYEQAVLRSEKNIVDTATLKFVRNNADDLKNIAGVRKPRAVGTRFDTPRKVEELQGMEWETPFTPNEINDALGQAEMEVLTQMELSTAGRRNFIPQADTMDYKVERQASSFPDWVPEHLREKDLFDKVINQYNKGIAQRANATKQKELYDVVQSEIASRVPMDVRDEMALTEIAKQSEVRASLVEKVKAKKGATIFESTNDPKILQLFEEGKPVWIEFKDEKLAIAFRGVGREKLGVLLNGVGAFTRFYSGLATRFNPEFALPNKIRDLQETMTFLASQGDVGFKGAAKTAVVDPASMKAVLDGVRGADTPGAKLYNEMRSLGGTTGGMGLSTRKQTQLNIDKIFNIASSRPRQAAQKLVEYVDNWNTIFEDSTRLSVYKIALEKGATKERAAFLAKEASINFNRSGRGGPVLNALWMFSNASIQGSTKMIRAMKNPKVAAAVGATIMGSVAAVSEWNDRVDPDWRDKVTKWDRINGLPIVLPTEDGSTRYMVIPISWGLKPILVMSNAGYDSVSGVDVDPLDATQRILSSFIDAYNPVGGTDLTSAVTPTILDAPVEVARNQSWSGSLIRPIPYNNEPKDIQYFQSLADTKQGRIAIDTTKKLQENYGILMSPADVDYVITQYIGGAGRSIKKTNEVLYGLSSDDPMPPADEWPFVSRFLRMRTSEETGQGAGGEIEKLKNSLSDQARERFQTNEEAEATYKTMKDLPQEVAAERFEILKETNPTLADKIVEIAKDEKKGLTYEDKLVKALGVENGERARYILEQFNKEKSDEAKAALWEEYQTKGLITKQVSEQLRYLLNQ